MPSRSATLADQAPGAARSALAGPEAQDLPTEVGEAGRGRGAVGGDVRRVVQVDRDGTGFEDLACRLRDQPRREALAAVALLGADRQLHAGRVVPLDADAC